MTRTAKPVRRSLAISSALGMSLGVFAAPAVAQQQGSFGTVNSTQTDGLQLPTQTPTFQVTPQTPTTGERLDIDLNSRNTIITWQNFNVPAGPSAAQTKIVSFNNGSLTSATDAKAVLNRVVGGNATEIRGIINTGTRNLNNTVTNGASNIQVWIVNGNGILLGSGANINTGGLVLSALDLDAASREAFRTTGPNGTYNVQFAGAAGSTAAISSVGNTPAVINTRNGLLALIAPQIDLNANTNSGTGATAYALATDVNLSTRPGGPLSITINAGTSIGSQTVSGAIVADRLYALLTPQAGVQALLGMSAATVTNATVNPQGVVVLGAAGTVTPTAGVTLTNGANAANSSVSVELGQVNLRVPVGGTAVGNVGSVQITGRTNSATGGNIAVGPVTIGGALDLSTGASTRGTIELGGTTNAGSIALEGANLALTGSATVTSRTDIVLDATAGTLSIAAGKGVIGNTAAQNGAVFQVGGEGTTGLSLVGSSLTANAAGNAGIRFTTATAANDFRIGNVEAARLTGKLGTAGATNNLITRTGSTGFGNVTLTATNATTIDASGSTDLLDMGIINSPGAVTLQGGTGGVSFATFNGAGAKTIVSGAGIAGTNITGAGTVTLTAAATRPITITGLLGTSVGTRLGALTINGSNGVTLGAAGATGTTAFLSTANIGQNAGTPVTSLTVNGEVNYSGDFRSDTTGSTTVGTFRSANAASTVDLGAGSSIAFGNLEGSATKLLAAGTIITGGAILDGGNVDLIAGGAIDVGRIGAPGRAVSNLRTDTPASLTLGAAGLNSVLSGALTVVNAAPSSVTLRGGFTASDLSLRSSGPIGFGGLTATGLTSLRAGGAITGVSIDGGSAELVTTGASPIAITGAIGAGTPLANLAVGGGTGITIGSAGSTGTTLSAGLLRTFNDTTQGAFRVNGASAVNTVSLAGIPGTVDFTGAVTGNGSGSFAVTAGGQTTLGGAVSGFTSFTSSGAGAVRLDGGALTTTGAQAFTGPLVLGANGTLTGTGATFSGGIQGNGFNLALNFSGTQMLAGGGVTGVRNLSTDAAGTTVLSGVLSTSGTQIFNDAVTLGGATTLISTGAGANGNISFAGTLGGANSLSVTTPGTVTFAGAVGAGNGNALTTITTTGAAQTALRANVTSTGAQSYGATVLNGGSDVVLNAGAANVGFTGLSGPRGLSVNTSGTTTLAGGGGAPLAFITTDAGGTTSVSGTISTVGEQTYNDVLSLGGATTLSGSLARFVGGVTGNGNDLTVATSGAQQLNGTVTGVRNLATDAAGTLTLNGAITTSGSQTFGEAVTLGSAVSLTAGATSAITFGGVVNGAQALTTDAGTTNINADIGTAQALASLGITGTAVIGGGGVRVVRTSGAQNYGGGLLLGADATLIGSTATFGAGVNGGAASRNLTLTLSGPTTLQADPFTNLGNLLINGAGTTTLNGDVTTFGSQTYQPALVLAGNATLTSTGGRAISLNGVSGGGNTLAVNTTGLTTFNAAPTGLASIATDAGGTTVLNGTIATTGTQSYGDNVLLGSAVTAQSSGGGAIGFGGTINGAQALTVQTTGITSFAGAVGTSTPLTSLSSTGTGAVLASGGAITTTGAQSYAGQLQLGANLVLTGTAGSFSGGVLGNGRDLTLNFSGPTTIAGGFSGINNLSSGGGGTTTLSGVIDTLGGQTFLDAVTLAGATVLRSNGGTGTGAIAFGSTLDGTQTLTVTTGGTTSFGGAVGAATPLASLAVDGAGAVAINGGAVITTGAQGYAGPATLGQNTVLTTDGGNVAFGATVTGPVQLSIRTSPTGTPAAGAVSFGDAATLNALAIRAQSATVASTTNRVGTLAALVGTGGLDFANATGLTVGSVDGLSGIAAGSGALTLNAGGLLTLAANTSAGATSLTGTGVTQTAGTAVNAGAGTITIDANDGALALAGSLTTSDASAAAVRLLDAGATQLGSITTGAGGTVTLGGAAGDSLSSTATQTLGSTITTGTLTGTVGGAATLNNANNIGTLEAFAANGLTLRNAGALSVTGPVTSGGTLTLQLDAGGLALNGDLTATGTTTLLVAGGITQAAGSVLTTPTLTGSAGGPVSLIGANRIGTLAGFAVTGGGLTLNDDSALSITQNVNVTGALGLTARGIDFTGRTLSATGTATLNGQGGAVTGTTLSAGSNANVAGDTIALGSATAGTTPTGTLTLAAQNGLTLGTGTAGQTISLATTNGVLSAGTLTAGAPGNMAGVTAITTSSGGATTIGSAASNNGALAITSGGALQLGAGVAGTTATLTAVGPLTLVNSLTSGGDAQLVATGAASVGTVTSSGGAVLVRGTSATVAGANAGTGLAIEATAGDAQLTTGTAGGNASVSATGTARVGTLGTTGAPVGGSVTIAGNGGDAIVGSAVAIGAATLTASGLAQAGTLSGSSVTGTGAGVAIGTSMSGSTLALTATGGALRLGTGTAGGGATLSATGPLTVDTGLTAGGAVTIGSGGDAALASVSTAAGDLAVTAAGNVTGVSGGRAALTATGTGADVRVVAGGLALLGPVRAADIADVRAGQIDLSTVNASSLALESLVGSLSLGTGTVAGAATLTAKEAIGITRLIAGGAVATTSQRASTIGEVSGSAVNIAGSRTTVDTATATTGALAIAASDGDLRLGNGNAGTTATLSASGTGALTVTGALIAGNAAAGGNVTTTSGGATTIATVQSKTGSVGITGASAEVGTATASNALTVNATAGSLVLGTGTATGGAASLNATGPLTVSNSLTSNGNAGAASSGGAATINTITSTAGSVAVSGRSAAVTTAAANQALSVTSTGGALTLGTGTATNGTATLTAAGPLSVTTRVTANGNATATATGGATVAAITSGNGAVAVSGTGATVTAATARTALDLTATAGDLTLGTGNAGGAATLRASGEVRSTSLTTGGAASLTAGMTLNSGSLNASGAATLTATGAATLGQTTSGGAVTVTGATIAAGQTAAATTLSLTSTGNLSLAGGSAGGNATVDAGGTATLGQVLAGSAATLSVRALDAEIRGIQRAGTVSFTNRAPTTTATRLGDGTAAGGFALAASEVNFVEANQLLVDAGGGNVEIGTLAFDADAGRARVDVLATGRLDVNGAVSGTGATRTFRFGGNAASPDAMASVIRVTATPTGGGRLLFDTADLDLRGQRIGVGQATGFLDPIGFGNATGLSAGNVGGRFVANANSSLYNASLGGATYAADTILVSARNLSVRFTDYALFQNTGAPGQNLGVALGTAAGGPNSGSLLVQGPGASTSNAFAFFGTIGGISGSSAAILGSDVITTSGVDLSNSRINGCLVGSGAGCLTAVVTQPLLAIFDASQVQVFRAGDDLALPFDPVVGTNNEALFSGIGVIDSGISDTECTADTTNPACGQAKEQGK